MKFTLVLLTTLIIQVSAHSSYAQKINITEKNASLETILKQIRQQSGYDFLFDSNLIDKAKAVNVQLKDATIDQALQMSLKNQNLIYTIEEHTVVIKEAPKPAVDSREDPIRDTVLLKQTPAVSGLVTGRVTNIKGEPLSGATVTDKRNKRGATTDANGIYVLTAIRPLDTLVVSFIGYKTLMVPMEYRPIINMGLEEATNRLDEVVVQAYGQTTQRLTTGSIGRVTAKDIETQPVTDPLLALEGRVAGVSVTPLSGYVGGPVKIEIRGRQSINPNISSDPLYVIDGVPQTVLDVNPGTNLNVTQSAYSRGIDILSMSNAAGQSPLYGYNPNDIASIEILKDASATAIYGSRGANGVILITTKHGEAGHSDFNFSVSQGARFVTTNTVFLNTQQYIAMRRDAFKNDGVMPTVQNAPDLFLLDSNRYTDWQKVAYGKIGTSTNAQLSLSGGNDQVTYRVSGSYAQNSDVSSVKGVNPIVSLSSNITTHSLNKRFTMSLITNYNSSTLNQVNLGAPATIIPDAPGIYTSDGSLNYKGWDAVNLGYPFGGLRQNYQGKTNNLTSSLNLDYQLIKGLDLKTNLGYTSSINEQTDFTPIGSQDPLPPGATASPTGSAQFGHTRSGNLLVEPQAEYKGIISKGTLDVLLGGSYQSNNTSALQVTGFDYTSDDLLHSISFAPSLLANDYRGEYKYVGVFGRINYNWEDKYIIDLNGRRDGSSRFGADNRFGNFGAVGVAWLATEEKWLKEVLPKAISLIKFRAGYGTTGSDGVGDYQYLPQWGSANGSKPMVPYNSGTAIVSTLLANPNFHWQVNKKLDLELDLGFFDDKLNVTANYYRDRCNNQLIAFPTPDITGYSSVEANEPANVQNEGWEFTFNTRIITNKKFSWSSSFNISLNSNKLLSYPHIELSPYYSLLVVGRSLGDAYVYKYTGLDSKTGQYTYLDANHDGIINSVNTGPPGTGVDDRVAIVNTNPKFEGGMGEHFTIDKFNIDLQFNYRKQTAELPFFTGAGSAVNISLYQYQHTWQNPGDQAIYARLTTNPQPSDQNYSASSGIYVNASYIRFENIAISYALPDAIAKKLGMKGLRVNLQAYNIFLITLYKGLNDPEASQDFSEPMSRQVTGGLTGSF